MNQWLTLTILIVSFGLMLWSLREFARWYLRINILEDKLDYLHKMLERIEEQLLIENEVDPTDEPKSKHSLFLLKERTENDSPSLQ